MTTIKERLINLLDYKGINKENFFNEIGVAASSFRGAAKKQSLNSDSIVRITTEIPELNLQWLITGKGEMLNEIAETSPQKHLENVKELEGRGRYSDEFVEQLMENHTKLVDSHQKLSDAHYLLTKEITESKQAKRERKLYTQQQSISQIAEPDVEYKKNK